MSDTLSITGIEVWNIGGIEHFRTKLGTTAIIVGENGAGKTSLLSAVQSVLEGGHDPSLIHQGADHAEILINLSNGAAIRKAITPKDSTLEVRTPDGGIVKGPATYVKSLVPSISFDPIGFLNADPKSRAAFLLETLPLTFTDKEVNEVLDVPSAVGPVPLQRLNEIREGKYAERTELNRKIRDLEGTVRDLRGSLPPDTDKNWADVAEDLTRQLMQKNSEIATVASEIALEAEQHKAKKRQEITQQIADLQETLNKYVATVDKTAAETLAEQTRDLEAQKAELSAQLGEARAKAEADQRAAGVREAIAKQTEAIKGSSDKADRLSRVITALDDLKVRKLKELPIEGLDITVEKGKPSIKINDIPLDRLNRQQQLFIAIRAVSLAQGKLPLILCEVAELDDEHLKELTSATEEAGIQLMVARWRNGKPLSVVSSEEYASA